MATTKEIGPLTDNCIKALSFLQQHEGEWVGSDLADAAGIKGIHPVMNSLVIRKLAAKGAVVREFTNSKGITMPKEYVTYYLTDAGKNYIFD